MALWNLSPTTKKSSVVVLSINPCLSLLKSGRMAICKRLKSYITVEKVEMISAVGFGKTEFPNRVFSAHCDLAIVRLR
jgi:hypothetical protein